MSYRKKFAVKGLKPRENFAASLEPVMARYLGHTQKRAAKYLHTPAAETLHTLRIALRRFRYVLELYCSCLKPRRFARIYEAAVDLQNLLGERRDIDVMREKLANLAAKTGAAIPSEILRELDTSRERLDRQIGDQLTRFLQNKHVERLAAG